MAQLNKISETFCEDAAKFANELPCNGDTNEAQKTVPTEVWAGMQAYKININLEMAKMHELVELRSTLEEANKILERIAKAIEGQKHYNNK